MAEYLDVLDENGVKTGEILPRDEVHAKGLWHRTVLIALVNDKNEILLQKRSPNKVKNPNMWDISVGGHIVSGQDALVAGMREINEEINVDLGYRVEVKDFRYIFSYRKEEKYAKDQVKRQFYDLFVLRTDANNDSITVQESEISEVKWVSATELQNLRAGDDLVERDASYDAILDYIFRL